MLFAKFDEFYVSTEFANTKSLSGKVDYFLCQVKRLASLPSMGKSHDEVETIFYECFNKGRMIKNYNYQVL